MKIRRPTPKTMVKGTYFSGGLSTTSTNQMRLFLTLLIILFAEISAAQLCNIDSITHYEIRASDTDPAIPWELHKHFVWQNTTCSSNGTLLLHLVGSFDNPLNTTYFPKLAANHGFHVIVLKYPNGTSAQTPCRNSSNADCYENFRREIIEGNDLSSDISVDASNSINNRLLKLLEYLNQEYPSAGWNSYFSGTSFNWNNIIVSGHSQGGGHAAVIAIDNEVKRVIMFASPNDYSDYFDDAANWTTNPHNTKDSAYYAFGNLYDDVVDFSEQSLQWNNLGLPGFGDTLEVNSWNCSINETHQFYTVYTSSGTGSNHSNMIRDSETPLDSLGTPVFEPVWQYLLGIPCQTTGLESPEPISFNVYPNPFDKQTILRLENYRCIDCILEIHDGLGQLVATVENIRSNRIIIDKGTLDNGVYIYRLRSKTEPIATGKLIVADR